MRKETGTAEHTPHKEKEAEELFDNLLPGEWLNGFLAKRNKREPLAQRAKKMPKKEGALWYVTLCTGGQASKASTFASVGREHEKGHDDFDQAT